MRPKQVTEDIYLSELLEKNNKICAYTRVGSVSNPSRIKHG
jgi:hypothetical protein